ncbi:MAG: hypothetical protein HQK65_17910, partial [Desulfamplus sp.]|nr:hypothetical protein [Desulfamplus sp.]
NARLEMIVSLLGHSYRQVADTDSDMDIFFSDKQGNGRIARRANSVYPNSCSASLTSTQVVITISDNVFDTTSIQLCLCPFGIDGRSASNITYITVTSSQPSVTVTDDKNISGFLYFIYTASMENSNFEKKISPAEGPWGVDDQQRLFNCEKHRPIQGRQDFPEIFTQRNIFLIVDAARANDDAYWDTLPTPFIMSNDEEEILVYDTIDYLKLMARHRARSKQELP